MLIINPDLINSCRVCRSPNQDGDYQCLFETVSEHDSGHETNLSESGVLYEKVLNISLNERNCYPKFMCNSCHLQMKLFIKLKDKALKTLEHLDNIYGEAVINTKEPIAKEILNYNYENNEQQIINPNEPQDCQDILDEFQVYQENAGNEYAENIIEDFNKTSADETSYENTKYSYRPEDVENNSYNEAHMEQGRLYIEHQLTNNEAAFEDVIKEQNNHAEEHNLLTKIEADEDSIPAPNLEKNFSQIKLEPTLDKHDYVTEIYELVDDECDVEEKYLENPELMDVIDSNSYAEEVNTEASSTYNDIEYLLEEEEEELEDPIENVMKSSRLDKRYKTNRTYECLSCMLQFENLQTYKSHRIESHCENFPCNACSKDFKSMTALQKHLKSQHNGPAFQCEICQKTFNQKAHFQYHMNGHNNIRNYKCDICEKAFIAKADLKTHLRLHTGKRPYICNVCGKDYLMMEHLKAHLIIHTGEIFSCNICHKQFATHKTLRLHVRTIHEEEPRFKCAFCLKPFRRKHHLQYHLKSHKKNYMGGIINETDDLEDLVEEVTDDTEFIS